MDTWYIAAHGDNPCIMYPFPDRPVQWRTEFYRGYDAVCEVLTKRIKLREKAIQKIVDKYDTYYYVFSCRRRGKKLLTRGISIYSMSCMPDSTEKD